MTEEEIQVTTADTLPLPPEQAEIVAYYAAKQEAQAANDSRMDATRETKVPDPPAGSQTDDSVDDFLLDLGDVKTGGTGIADDFVLDLDLDEPAEPSPAVAAYSAPSFMRVGHDSDSVAPVAVTPTVDPMAHTQPFPRPGELVEAAPAEQYQPSAEKAQASTNEIDLRTAGTSSGLSPEIIDAIARRAVEQLSEKVVQEIAWEVVPQLAELMIKRQLEEKNS